MKDSSHFDNDSSHLVFDRRYFLSLPALAGSLGMLNARAYASSPDLMAAAYFVQQNVSVSDSVTLYANLLPNIRKMAFQQKLQEIGILKQLASGHLDTLIASAQRLRTKYSSAEGDSRTELLEDFRGLIREVEDTWMIRDAVDRSRNELPTIIAIEEKIDVIHSHLLKASEYFAKAKEQPKPEGQVKPNADGKRELEDAIKILQGLLKGKINESQLDSPIERLIVLLRGVEFAVGREQPSVSANGSSQSGVASHHARVVPASSIMQVLRRHVRPGSWLQVGIGYGVAFPVLLRNSNAEIRRKLLMDGLRLVPGLVPSPLEDAAKELASLSL